MYAAPILLKKTFAPPQRDTSRTPADFGLSGEQIWLESVNGTSLHAWFIPAVDTPAPAVVVLHGWGANGSLLLPFAPYLHEAGYHALFLDARNHGLSEHDDFSSLPRFAEDLEVGIAWLRERDDVTSLGVAGHPVGAGAAILAAAKQTGGNLIVVEDHYEEGGLGDAVLNAVGNAARVLKLAVREIPRSGPPEALLEAYGISSKHIVQAVKSLL